MVKIEAVIQPSKLDEANRALDALGVEVTMVSGIRGHAGPLGRMAFYRGAEYHLDVPKVKLEMLVSSDRADEVIDALLSAARSPEFEDNGTILVYEVADAIRIRTGARLQYSVY